jgi:FKBP-type peptidyl-prolyl cis-trans isomerase
VIKGWTEGVQLMKVGSSFRFAIPGKLAYEGNPSGPQGVLVFDVELLAIEGGAPDAGGIKIKMPQK